MVRGTIAFWSILEQKMLGITFPTIFLIGNYLSPRRSSANSPLRASMTSNPLDRVLKWYRTTLDSIRVTERVVKQRIPRAITNRHASFKSDEISDNIIALEEAKKELARVVVLALVAVFERTLRDHLKLIPIAALPPGDSQRDAVREAMLDDIEYWNITSRVLELFPAVDANLRGQVKQILEYRNWVAHGHTIGNPPPSNVDPAQAYQRLSAYLTQAGILFITKA